MNPSAGRSGVPKSVPAAPYHHGDLRNALIEAALSRLDSSGSSDFSLSELARLLKVTPAAAYKHFVDKEELLAELAALGFLRLGQAFEQAAPREQTPVGSRQAMARLERLGQAYYDFGLAHRGLFHLMFGAAGAAYRQKAMASGRSSGTYEYLDRALTDLYRLKQVTTRPNATHAWIAWCLVHGATELAIAQTTGIEHAKTIGRKIAAVVVNHLK